MTPLQRLLFAQGGKCFFCGKKLSNTEASVEHLIARAHGGNNHDENCVVCCKTLNSLFGKSSLKEKLQILLNQRAFRCPMDEAPLPESLPVKPTETRFAQIVDDLHRRGNSRPGRVDKLVNTIRECLRRNGEPVSDAEGLVDELKSHGFVTVKEMKVNYTLPQRHKSALNLPPAVHK